MARPLNLLLQKQSLLEVERWAASHENELTDLDLNSLNECRASLCHLQRQSILWEAQGRPASLLLEGREIVEAKRWADEHGSDLFYTDHQFLLACQAKMSELHRRALLWESQARPPRHLLQDAELLESRKMGSGERRRAYSM